MYGQWEDFNGLDQWSASRLVPGGKESVNNLFYFSFIDNHALKDVSLSKIQALLKIYGIYSSYWRASYAKEKKPNDEAEEEPTTTK